MSQDAKVLPDSPVPPLKLKDRSALLAMSLIQAQCYRELGDFVAAEAAYRDVLTVDASNAKANQGLGCIAFAQSGGAEALTYFLKALEQDTASPENWRGYAQAFIAQGMHEGAREILQTAATFGVELGGYEQLCESVRLQAVYYDCLSTIQRLSEALDFDKVIQLSSESLRLFSDDPALLRSLAVAYMHKEQTTDALALLDRLCQRLPNSKECWSLLGMALQHLGRHEDAYRSYLRALDIDPYDVFILTNLGKNLLEIDFIDDAAVWFRLASLVDQNSWPARLDYARILIRLGDFAEAKEVIDSGDVNQAFPQDALDLIDEISGLEAETEPRQKPLRPAPLSTPSVEDTANLMILYGQERHRDMGVLAKKICEACPLHPFAWKVLGLALRVEGYLEQALTATRLAVATAPDDTEALCHLGGLANQLNKLPEAEKCARRALSLDQKSIPARILLGLVMIKLQRREEGEKYYREVLEIDPGNINVMPYFQFAMNADQNTSQEEILSEAKKFGQLIQVRKEEMYNLWRCNNYPKKLRVGFVSGDFRTHPVARSLEPLLAYLSKDKFETFAYSNHHSEDDVTERLKKHFFGWRSLVGKGDAVAARMVHDDKLHILIDLSGFTAFNRLPLFARKPAPVQVTWLGYFSTTGVPQIDYFISNKIQLFPQDARYFVEKLWFLPGAPVVIYPPDIEISTPIDVGDLPALENEFLTFGSFNRLMKINDNVVKVWSTILHEVPGSVLLLNAGELESETERNTTYARFFNQGISADRLILMDWRRSREEHLSLYNKVDIALDSFPYCGSTTSMEAMWMGVPVLSMKGDSFVSRIGETTNTLAGMREWIAVNSDDYVEKAKYLAQDIKRLASIRKGLREKVLSSPMFDAPRFAKDFEAALWGMWNKYILDSRKNKKN
ncbi:MAG: tetratricopeptide repeat protein [Rhodocyclaceae bacterium]|nr:tetratricopeptide repeat protein [Rhodocyclaceae bacterium]